jgi:hypothetical protein
MKDYKNNEVSDEPCWQAKLVDSVLFFGALAFILITLLLLAIN